ncbi:MULTISPECIES: hypothetical protein [Enterococcus]|uniref:hypothetical protein n=1 Tax=Enterococcus TaxID=1350 RepID=UPI000CF19E7B|nr:MULTISPECIES: hypothetical protein [Enterococcus]EGO5987465.1 hypothetical protein [Enterococcus faecalis]EGO6657253.1 hypothetical protein [Enterococcus faecalis]EGO8922519.1 hypothetical protein [Enterococcus faecalis]EHQ2627023.1 hypothetical protein [Enterococcus faecalis]EKS9943335.1 hypothetical protein [Enterococcus faecalis]
MKTVDMEIYNYIKKMVGKDTSIIYEQIYNEGYDTPLIQIIIKNVRIKEFIYYDYEHVESLDDIKKNLDIQISCLNSRINRRNKKLLIS